MTSNYSDPFPGKPWMYSKPSGNENYKKWCNEWTSVFLNFCEENKIHLIHRNDLKQLFPLSHLDGNSYDALIDNLIKTKYITNWGNGNLRIHWKSIQGWLDTILEKAREMDKNVIFGPEELVELSDSLVTMPRSELEKILNLAVEQKIARWVEEKNRVLKLL